jgi:hypothetical protein
MGKMTIRSSDDDFKKFKEYNIAKKLEKTTSFLLTSLYKIKYMLAKRRVYE